MIAMPAPVVTGPRASSGDSAAAGVWASLHHTATLVSLDDADLVACAVGTSETAPDAEAFGVLYERYVHRVFAFALSRLHDRTQAEDVTSQTFLQALQALPRYQQRGVPISDLLTTIVTRPSPVILTKGLSEKTSLMACLPQLSSQPPDEWHGRYVDRSRSGRGCPTWPHLCRHRSASGACLKAPRPP